MQNAFVKVFRHRRRYRKRGQFRAFFLKVVLNEARMKLRRKRRRMNLLQKMSRQIQTLSDNTVAVATNPNSWPLLQKVRRHYRDVIALRYGAELKLEEIAEVLQIPVGTVKSRLFNGLRELKALLEAE